jgi:acetyltransferase-like isoleucine patch superfamily enzyme
MDRSSAFELGAGSSIGHGTILSVQSGPQAPGVLRIGEDTWIGEYNSLRTDGAELRIGSRCLISQFVSLVATGHEYRDARVPIREQGVSFARGLTVGDDVWIGAGASVMPGVTVGDGAVIASGAVVMRNVPRYSIVAGVPAQVMGKRSNRP